MYTKINTCRVCGNSNLIKIVDLGMQKLTGIFPEHGQEVNEGPLVLMKCMPNKDEEKVCGLVQLGHSCESSEMYGENYGYRSGLNLSMIEHLKEITGYIKNIVKINDDDLIIDIGSNDGTLLRSYERDNLDYIGIDPTGNKFKKYYPSNITLIIDFFSSKRLQDIRGNKKAKIITSIAMFYDLDDPIKFAREIYEIIADDGIWVIEQSYLPAMLEANSFDTICQEHLEFYCLLQIEWIVKAAGMKVIDVSLNDTNGGSFRCTISKENAEYQESRNVQEIRKYEENNNYNSISVYTNFNKRIEESKEALMKFIIEEKAKGKKIYGYGASTKGNVLLQYCGITDDDIIAIAEVNEDKFGHVTPGTEIPIISEQEAKKDNPDYFIVLPWHFRDNILEKEKEYRKCSGCKFVFPLPKLEVVNANEG